ncbi:transmembrane protein [Cystoisospora suis]|uniref:Transmembrane protein n=1 Tax=Cystoisospora suis TaxID=483139 RepID=A0A2C6L044_9APIC|nr:transmembrane protein [Cystoisospora suis]
MASASSLSRFSSSVCHSSLLRLSRPSLFSTTASPPQKLLERNVHMKEILTPRWVLEPPNFVRRPVWRQWWEAQFGNKTFFFFGNAWTSAAAFALFIWWSRVFDPPPKERLDRYWLNSQSPASIPCAVVLPAKFRILSAFHNPGKRPGLKISLMTYEARYCYRGLDHPFTLNEIKDFLYKLREQYLVNKYEGIQFPFVFRQYNRVQTPGTLEVRTAPALQSHPFFEEDEGGHHH